MVLPAFMVTTAIVDVNTLTLAVANYRQ